MADGRVIIDTALDTSGIEKGAINLKNILTGGLIAASLATMKKAISDIAQETEKLNTSIRKASTLFGGVDVNIGNLTTKIRALSVETGNSADELGSALYDALSAGIPATEDMSEALSFLEASAKTAKGGFADLSATVTATASVLNAYGLSVEETDRVQGILMQTQNKGITTVGALATSLAQVVPTAAAMGVSFEQVGAALATITASGTQTAQATTGLNAALSELGKSGQTAANNLLDATEAAGLGRQSFSELVAQGYDLGEILRIMSDYASSSGLSLIDMFGSVEAGRAALQLAANDGDKFNQSMKDMSDTAGLVENASSTMTTGFQKLSQSWSAAKTTIGQVFRPAVEGAAGSLATMIAKVTGNYDAVGKLEPALQALKDATEAYRQAQEDAAGSTGTLTEAMLSQSRVAMTKALNDYIAAYKEANETIDQNRDNIEKARTAIKANENDLQRYADHLGVAREELSAFINTLDEDNNWRQGYEQIMSDLMSMESYLSGLESTTAEANSAISATRSELAKLARDGMLDLDDLKDKNFELYSAVLNVNKAYSEGVDYAGGLDRSSLEVLEAQITDLQKVRDGLNEASYAYNYHTGMIEALIAAYDDLAISQGAATWGSKPSASSVPAGGGSNPTPVAEETERTVQDVIKDYESAIAAADKLKDVMGDDFDATAEKISAVESAIRELISSFDLDPASAEVQNLKASLDGLKATQALEVFDDLDRTFSQIDAKGQVLGEDFDVLGKKISATEDAIETLIVTFNLDPASDDVQKLKKQLEDLRSQAEETSNIFAEMFTADWGASTFADTLTAGFRALGDVVGGAKERIEELQETIDEAYEDMADAQEDLADAQARNDQKAIKAAQEKIKGYEKTVKAAKSEQEALESGEEGWKAFGRAALKALAETLYGLGAQLAAQATLLAISFRFGEAAAAGAASLAAFGAALAVQGAAGSFAEGGIVPQVSGVPSTGDQHLARVNPGELILNQAQQQNLADQILAMQQLDRYSAGSGSAVIVNMTGAYIYGLDAPEVGKAIYRNIKTLQMEGILRK